MKIILMVVLKILFLKILFIYFLERMEGREKQRERKINVWLPLVHPLLGTWPATQACALNGNQTGDPLVHRLVLNPLSHTSQGYLFIFREGGGKKRGRETDLRKRDGLPLVCTLTWDSTRNPDNCPDLELNQQPFALRAMPNHLSHTRANPHFSDGKLRHRKASCPGYSW